MADYTTRQEIIQYLAKNREDAQRIVEEALAIQPSVAQVPFALLKGLADRMIKLESGRIRAPVSVEGEIEFDLGVYSDNETDRCVLEHRNAAILILDDVTIDWEKCYYTSKYINEFHSEPNGKPCAYLSSSTTIDIKGKLTTVQDADIIGFEEDLNKLIKDYKLDYWDLLNRLRRIEDAVVVDNRTAIKRCSDE